MHEGGQGQALTQLWRRLQSRGLVEHYSCSRNCTSAFYTSKLEANLIEIQILGTLKLNENKD
jgi:hypothetical protein